MYIMSVDLGWPDATWQDAKDKCASKGWYLASILTERDQELMVARVLGFKEGVQQGYYRRPPVEPDCVDINTGASKWPCGMWIGANDREEEGNWRWSNGQLLSQYGGLGAFDNYTGTQIRGRVPWSNTTVPRTDDDEPNNFVCPDNTCAACRTRRPHAEFLLLRPPCVPPR